MLDQRFLTRPIERLSICSISPLFSAFSEPLLQVSFVAGRWKVGGRFGRSSQQNGCLAGSISTMVKIVFWSPFVQNYSSLNCLVLRVSVVA